MSRECSSVMPMPVSRTSMTTQPDSSAAARMDSSPPSGMACTAFKMRRTRASRSSKAMPSTGGRASISWEMVMTTPRRSASSRQRGAVRSSASYHRGQAHGAEGDLGLARHEVLEAAHGGRGLEGDITHDHEPAMRGGVLGGVAEEQLRVGEDGGQRVVEVVGEATHRLAQRAQVVPLLEPAAVLRYPPGEIARPAPEGEDGAIDLDLGARHLARNVLDLLVVGEEEGILGGRRLHPSTDPLAESIPDPSHARRSRP